MGANPLLLLEKQLKIPDPLILDEKISRTLLPKASMQFPTFFPDLKIQLAFQNSLLSAEVNSEENDKNL